MWVADRGVSHFTKPDITQRVFGCEGGASCMWICKRDFAGGYILAPLNRVQETPSRPVLMTEAKNMAKQIRLFVVIGLLLSLLSSVDVQGGPTPAHPSTLVTASGQPQAEQAAPRQAASGLPQAAPAPPVASALAQSPEKPVPFAVLLKKSVAFVTTDYEIDEQIGQVRGTAFFVFVADKRLGENAGFVYLVTNRHIVEPEIDGRRAIARKTSLRLNLKTPMGDTRSAEGVLTLGRLGWFFPKDDAVDLAVIPLAPDQARFDYEPFPVSLFATDEVIKSQGVAEGDAVLFTGFFYQLQGLKKVQPIVRQGILAMMPDEELETTLHKPGRLFLADVHVFGGNSGAPIFVNVSGLRGSNLLLGGFPWRLLGVVSGYFYETQDFQLHVATTLSGKVNANSGISVVVPADEIKTLLDSPELRTLREAEIARKAK